MHGSNEKRCQTRGNRSRERSEVVMLISPEDQERIHKLEDVCQDIVDRGKFESTMLVCLDEIERHLRDITDILKEINTNTPSV